MQTTILFVVLLTTVTYLSGVQGQANGCPNATHCGDCLGSGGIKHTDGFGSQCTWCAQPLTDGSPQCNVRTDVLNNPCGHGCVECFTDTCDLDHQLLWLIIVPVVAGLLLFGCIALYCCCCRGRTQQRIDKALRKEDRLAAIEREKRLARQGERRDERAGKMDEYRAKYGLNQKNEAFEDPLKESLLDDPVNDPYK